MIFEHDIYIHCFSHSLYSQSAQTKALYQVRSHCCYKESSTSICSSTSALNSWRLKKCYMNEWDKCAFRALQRDNLSVKNIREMLCIWLHKTLLK
jgi:hypothetical protein